MGNILAQLGNELPLVLKAPELAVSFFGLELEHQLLDGLLLVLENFLPKIRVVQKDLLLLILEVDCSLGE